MFNVHIRHLNVIFSKGLALRTKSNPLTWLRMTQVVNMSFVGFRPDVSRYADHPQDGVEIARRHHESRNAQVKAELRDGFGK